MATSTAALFLRRYVLDAYGLSGRSGPRPNADAESPIPLGDDGVATGSPLRILILNWRDVANPQAGGAELFTHEVARRWVSWATTSRSSRHGSLEVVPTRRSTGSRSDASARSAEDRSTFSSSGSSPGCAASTS